MDVIWLLGSNVTVVNDEQFLNPSFPSDVTSLGMSNDVMDEFMNASCPIVSNSSAPVKSTVDNDVQPKNAWTPIVVTKLGMVIEVNAVYPNALSPIDVTVSGMVTEVNAVQL